VLAFGGVKSMRSGRISDVQKGDFICGILRFCELLQGRNPVFWMFLLKRLSNRRWKNAHREVRNI
jgi:hypothetical protein